MAILGHAFSDELSGSLAPEMNGFHDPEPGGRRLAAARVRRQPEVMVTMLTLLETSMS
jgi:hypothetical protein